MPILYVAGVSITDNPKDVAPRLMNILREVSVVVGEERRAALRLMNAADAEGKELFLINEHSSDKDRLEAAKAVFEAQKAVFFSDSGTPCISDPDFKFINICVKMGIEVKSIPGPSSITAAISVSGIDAKRFYFAGFPPRGGAERAVFFSSIAQSKCVTVFMERPYALESTLSDMASLGRDISLSISLGSPDERTLRGKPDEIISMVKGVKSPFVIVVPGIEKTKRFEKRRYVK